MKKLFLLALAAMFLVIDSWATIEYARRERKACIYCHFSDRGGPRNFLGHYYSKNGYSFRDTIYGEPTYEKQPPMPPDLSFKRPTAEGRIIERQLEILKSIHYRNFSGPSYYAAAQLVQSGKDFATKLDLAGIAYNKNLEEILVREVFGVGRYNIEESAFHSGMGLDLKYGPLVHLKARNAKQDPAEYLNSRMNFFKKVDWMSIRI